MSKTSREEINRLLNQYRALIVERLEVENAICKGYETIMSNNGAGDSAQNLKLTTLKERLNHINKEKTRTDKKIQKMLKLS